MNDNSSISTHDPWLPLPPKSGKGGTNETLSNYRDFQVYGRLVPSERSLPRTAQILRRTRGPMERLSIQFDWAKRAGAWDCRRAEISAQERTAAVIAATRKQVEQRAGRWGEYREKVWIELRQLIETVKPLTSEADHNRAHSEAGEAEREGRTRLNGNYVAVQSGPRHVVRHPHSKETGTTMLR